MISDVDMMAEPLDWPMWPVLPLKRMVGGEEQHGFLLAEYSMPHTVHIGYVWDTERVLKAMTEEGKGEHIKYETYDQIRLDGWQVD